MEKKFSGYPGMVSPAYTSPSSSCGGMGSHKHWAGSHKHLAGSPTMSYPTSMGYPTNVSPAAMGGYPTSYGSTMGGYPASFGSAGYPSGYGPATAYPTQVAPTTTMPPIVSPTNHCTQTNVYKHIVPHIHPSHKTTINQHVFQHQHHFPHTESCVNTCCNQQVICGIPGCPSRPHY